MIMKKFKRIAVFALALIAALALSGCETYQNFYSEFFEEKPDVESFTIGVFEPLTGKGAQDAESEVRGIKLANELFPEVMGKPVTLLCVDNQSDVEMARKAAQRLVDEDVDIVLGSAISTLTLAGSDIFEAAGMPAICMTCTNPIITQTNEFYFRVCFIDAYQGISAAKYVLQSLDRGCAACLLEEGDDYAAKMVEQFKETMEQLTGTPGCVSVIKYPADEKDLSSYLGELAATGCESVFFPSTPEEGRRILEQAYELELSMDWIGSFKWSGISSAEEKNGSGNNGNGKLPAYLDGICYVRDYEPSAKATPMTKRFNEAYAEKYGADELPDEACALGFDAYLLALEAIKLADGSDDGVAIASKLKSIRRMEGATGYISMNSDGDPIKDVVIEMLTLEGPVVAYKLSIN